MQFIRNVLVKIATNGHTDGCEILERVPKYMMYTFCTQMHQYSVRKRQYDARTFCEDCIK